MDDVAWQLPNCRTSYSPAVIQVSASAHARLQEGQQVTIQGFLCAYASISRWRKPVCIRLVEIIARMREQMRHQDVPHVVMRASIVDSNRLCCACCARHVMCSLNDTCIYRFTLCGSSSCPIEVVTMRVLCYDMQGSPQFHMCRCSHTNLLPVTKAHVAGIMISTSPSPHKTLVSSGVLATLIGSDTELHTSSYKPHQIKQSNGFQQSMSSLLVPPVSSSASSIGMMKDIPHMCT